jgi:hypothetical protein
MIHRMNLKRNMTILHIVQNFKIAGDQKQKKLYLVFYGL